MSGLRLRLRLDRSYLARLEDAAEPWLWRFLLVCSAGLAYALLSLLRRTF